MLGRSRISWDLTVDVIVIGCGCAGVVAAATAHDEGADVLVLEKQPLQSHHTNSSMSAGMFISPSDVSGASQYLETLSRAGNELYWTPEEVIRVWAEYTADNKAWVEANGGRILKTAITGEHPQVPGYEAMTVYSFRGVGYGLAAFLSHQLVRRNIPVMYDTAALRLLTNMKREVVGVEAENRLGGQVKRLAVRASKGVIMACGGFEFNEQMKLDYLPVYPSYFSGSEANTGDGIRMALEVGADLWHMNCVSARFGMKFSGFPIAFAPDFRGGSTMRLHLHSGEAKVNPGKRCGYICVDRYGKRFTNENYKVHALYYELVLFDSQRLIYPRVPSYWIFDRKRIELGPLPRRTSGPAGPSPLYRWSSDNGSEIAKGWILTAGTIRDLAGLLKMPPGTLQDTVETYNRYCERGFDPDFGRSPSGLVPLEQPPYYAVELWPGGANTQGGPRRNAKAEVLSADAEPIAGLYSAGELGSMYGMLYPNAGSNLGECIAFGRIAGEGAARREA